MVAVYCENHTEHINTLCEQNAVFFSVDAGGTYMYQYSLKEYFAQSFCLVRMQIAWR
jgi:hypothetical protein